MTRTLILAVDRDDDFGVKGGVETPVIGIEQATDAAIALGTADPEDSDLNGIFAAMNIYKELSDEGKDVEIALVCGDKKVGHRSDSALVDELMIVLDRVKPDRAILVGDGAEDEVVYPIVSSRVPVDSVRKVYVKQAPGLEGTFYIFSKMLSDPQKRKRFLVPLGLLLSVIALVYIAVNSTAFVMTNDINHIIGMAAPIVILLIGILILLYGYNYTDRMTGRIDEWIDQLRESRISLLFTVLALAMVVAGVIIGIFAIKNIMGSGIIYVTMIFVTNVLWPLAFAYLFLEIGKKLDDYLEHDKEHHTYMTSSVMVFGIAFIIQATIDVVRNYLGYGTFNNMWMLAEMFTGIILMVLSSIVHVSYKRYYARRSESAADEI